MAAAYAMVIDPVSDGHAIPQSGPCPVTFSFIKKYTGNGDVDMLPKRNRLLNINAFVSDRSHTDQLPINAVATALLERLGFELDSVIDKTVRGKVVITSSLASRPGLTQQQMFGICVLCAQYDSPCCSQLVSTISIDKLFYIASDADRAVDCDEEGEEEKDDDDDECDGLQEFLHDEEEKNVVSKKSPGDDEDDKSDKTAKMKSSSSIPPLPTFSLVVVDKPSPSTPHTRKRGRCELTTSPSSSSSSTDTTTDAISSPSPSPSGDNKKTTNNNEDDNLPNKKPRL